MANMQNDEEDGALDQRALLAQLGGGNTGVAGNRAEVAATRGQAPPLMTDAAAPGMSAGQQSAAGGGYMPVPEAGPAKPAQTYALEGYDAGKLASDHDSAKYQIGRTLQNYDFKQGVTPEVLGALNALGIGQFSGAKDKLRVTGGSHGLQGDTDLDVIHGFNSSSGPSGWQYGVENDNVTRGGGGAAKPPMATSVGLPAAQQTATNTLNAPSDSAFFDELLKRMRDGAGDDVMNQSALLQQLG